MQGDKRDRIRDDAENIVGGLLMDLADNDKWPSKKPGEPWPEKELASIAERWTDIVEDKLRRILSSFLGFMVALGFSFVAGGFLLYKLATWVF